MAHLVVSPRFVVLLFEVLTLKVGNFVPDVTLRHCCVIKYECQDELNLGYWHEGTRDQSQPLFFAVSISVWLCRTVCLTLWDRAG